MPAHADARAGFEIAFADIIHRFAAVDEHRAPPFSADVVLVLHRAGRQLGRPRQLPFLVFWRDGFVFIATNAAIAAGKEAQIRRHTLEITGFNPAEVAAHHESVFIVKSADPDVLRLHNREIDVRSPGRVRIINGITLGIAPHRHQAAARTGAADHHARIKQHCGVGDVGLRKVVETPAQVDRPLPAAGEVPEARDSKRGGILFGIV
ncbi:hypothetical protein D3C80_1115520 [compost metagenome]